MSNFIHLSTEKGTVAVNPETITYISKLSVGRCDIHFMGGETLTLNEDYTMVCDKLVQGKGFRTPK